MTEGRRKACSAVAMTFALDTKGAVEKEGLAAAVVADGARVVFVAAGQAVAK